MYVHLAILLSTPPSHMYICEAIWKITRALSWFGFPSGRVSVTDDDAVSLADFIRGASSFHMDDEELSYGDSLAKMRVAMGMLRLREPGKTRGSRCGGFLGEILIKIW